MELLYSLIELYCKQTRSVQWTWGGIKSCQDACRDAKILRFLRARDAQIMVLWHVHLVGMHPGRILYSCILDASWPHLNCRYFHAQAVIGLNFNQSTSNTWYIYPIICVIFLYLDSRKAINICKTFNSAQFQYGLPPTRSSCTSCSSRKSVAGRS